MNNWIRIRKKINTDPQPCIPPEDKNLEIPCYLASAWLMIRLVLNRMKPVSSTVLSDLETGGGRKVFILRAYVLYVFYFVLTQSLTNCEKHARLLHFISLYTVSFFSLILLYNKFYFRTMFVISKLFLGVSDNFWLGNPDFNYFYCNSAWQKNQNVLYIHRKLL